MMYVGIALILCSLVYSILVITIFQLKPHIKSVETNIYKLLLFSNLFNLILELGCFATISQSSTIPILAAIVSRLFLISLLIWNILFSIYVFGIGLSQTKKEKNILNCLYVFEIVSFVIATIIVAIVPLNYFYEKKTMYSYGLSADFITLIFVINLFLSLLVGLSKIKTIKIKKLLPLFLLFLMMGLCVIIRTIEPGLNILSCIMAFVTLFMYFTIENPDMKMVQQLNIARDQADKANNAKSEFLSSMSHEIRTPLNAIVGFSQALSEEDIPDSAKEEVKDIMSASESLLELVNGILDISKIEANKLEIINNDYKPKEMLHDLVALTKARMGDKNLDLRIKFDETIPDVLYGDKTRVKQIILNLLTNSVKYTKEGFIEFKVNSVIKGNVCRLIVSVEDSGIGIKKENIEKLFTKFERLDEHDNVTIEGTGLGLAITKRLVELMNGKIVVQSDYGVGSKFTVSIDQRIIKMKEENVEVKEVVNDDNYSDFSDKHILLVDDNMLNIKVAERLLKNYNVNVKSLNNGFDAIDIINNGEKFDLILMDDMMPKLSGVETFKKLKENSNFSIPTVILTANAIEGMKDKYLKEGFDDYLSKPIVKDELNRVLNKFLKGSN